MNTAHHEIFELMASWHQPTPTEPTELSPERYALRHRLIAEEFLEFSEAYQNGDFVEMADAVIDMLVVVIGTGVEMGIPIGKMWDEVHRSNLTKIDPEKGVVFDRGGKVMKPDCYEAPDLVQFIPAHLHKD